MSLFTSLPVKSITQLTSESVKVCFDISSTDEFDFLAGQYITVKSIINGEEVRRAYSICSAPSEGLEIGVKLVKGGKMSTFLTKELKIGESLDVMTPSGNFISKSIDNHIVGICAGSGVTPILSIIKSELEKVSDSRFTLIYGNKSQSSTMFKEQLEQLEKTYCKRLKIHWFFSQEKVQKSSFGRIDKDTLHNLINTFDNIKQADNFFICGPGEVIDNSSELLVLNNVNKSNIHYERFFVDESENDDKVDNVEMISNVIVSVDGDDFEFTLSSKGQTILDAAMENGADVPFSCKGAVCCTCKGKVIKGSVTMDANYSLSEDEVAEGFILGCQARPASSHVLIDFDEM